MQSVSGEETAAPTAGPDAPSGITIGGATPARPRSRQWMRSASLALLVLLLSLSLFLFRGHFERLGDWGYAGMFLVMMVNNATIVLPSIGYVLLMASALVLNPWLLGLVGGVGGTIGELTAYVFGRSGHAVIAESGLYRRVRPWMRWTGAVLFIFSALPLPFDVAGILAGSMRYSVWRFLLWTCLGKIVKATAIALASYHALGWLARWFGF